MSENQAVVAIKEAEQRFVEIAPDGMPFIREEAFALQLLKANDYLLKAAQSDPVAMKMAMTNVGAIGLSLNPAEKYAYLLPRKGKICLDVSYMGMMKIATDSGAIKWVQTGMVHANDNFIDNGIGAAPTPGCNPFAKPSERGEYVGAYCVAKTADGDFLTTTMTIDELNGIKGRSEAGKRNSGPWVTDFTEQCKKTVVRRAFKMWPRSTGMERLAVAVDISNQNEEFEPIETSPEISSFNPMQKELFDQHITNSDALGMFVFSKTIDVPVFQSLYGSFKQGEKGKYKQIVNTLVADGGNICREWLSAIEECGGDESVVIGFVEDYKEAPDVTEYIKDQLSAEAVAFFNEVTQ